jgi:hypothetical protein
MRSQFLPENVINFWLVLYLNQTDQCVLISQINAANKHITRLTGQPTAEW